MDAQRNFGSFWVGGGLETLLESAMSFKLACIAFFGIFTAACVTSPASNSVDFNAKILTAVHTMPSGGQYDGSDETKNLLRGACSLRGGEIRVNASRAKPSFCSGATYLVLLEALGKGSEVLLPKIDQQDGHGIFGRWNANGPGAAKLVADLRAGRNFTAWDQAKPGDFLKIWWTEKIGGRERGHLVVYLGHDSESVRFWSSNQPGGYGSKSVPHNACKRVLFTRVTHPENFGNAEKLPAIDPWLVRMLREDFTWAEVVAKCRVE